MQWRLEFMLRIDTRYLAPPLIQLDLTLIRYRPDSKKPSFSGWAFCLHFVVVMGRIELPTYGL